MYVRYFITNISKFNFHYFSNMNKKRQQISYETKRDILQITKKLNCPYVNIINPVLRDKLGIYIYI